ncbi:MAG: response regulator [Opitutaceae bacterium]|nr:response regulator [Opitutaceae bacterium]
MSETNPSKRATPRLPAVQRTLLVVDDERSVRETLRLLLDRRGYRVLVADKGADALALAASNRVDGAMVDVHMLGVDGVTLCRALRMQAQAAGGEFPVWLMSGARSTDVIKAGLAAGAIEVIGKPFDLAQLFAMLEAYFNPPVAVVVPGENRPA